MSPCLSSFLRCSCSFRAASDDECDKEIVTFFSNRSCRTEDHYSERVRDLAIVTKILDSNQNRMTPAFRGCYRSGMNRRQFLQRTSIAGASLAAAAPLSLLSGCAARRSASSTANRAYEAPDISFIGGACGLPPVHVSADREIRTVVGLRPYRPSGFVVRGEKLDDTLVIHNYGHGGGGITLSWGTAKLGLDLGLPGHNGPVAVLGCGAVGLATARLLQEAGAAVTIYAKDLPPNTTSNIAGGQWFPAFVSQPEKRTALFNQQFQAAVEFAYQRYQIMVGPQYGVRWMRNYFLDNQPWN